MKNLHTTLTVGFWFGEEMPSHNSEILTKTFDGENLLIEYSIFESQYEEFKRVNSNNSLPYKSNLADEQCFIFFPEPVGLQMTTFMEVKLMAEHLFNLSVKKNQTIKKIDDEIEILEEQKKQIEQLKEEIV